MLEKIIKIDNVGVLKAAIGPAVALKQVNVVYADNARGKSTLSAILAASSAGDAGALSNRKTIGATSDQLVQFRFHSANGASTCSFDGKSWSAPTTGLHVFNQEFVERNVYAGGTPVTPEQRASLLELALGSEAVAQRQEFQRQAEAQRNAASRVTACETALEGFHQGTALAAFVALEPVADGAKQIAALDIQLSEARNVQQISNRQDYRKLPAPVYALSNIRAIITTHFETLQRGAEAVVRAHLDAHLGRETERWVNDGMRHKPEPQCPFCGQATDGLPLISAYKTYFDKAYRDHIERIAALPGLADHSVSEGLVPEWVSAIEFNRGAYEGWSGLVPHVMPSFDLDAARNSISKAREIVVALVAEKVSKPLEAVSDAPLDDAAKILEPVVNAVVAYNQSVLTLNAQIGAYKSALAKLEVPAIQGARRVLELRIARDAPAVQKHIGERGQAELDRKHAEQKKDAARKKLDELMTTSLVSFQTAINARLQDFGAPFSVQELKPSYLGGGVPRGEYHLELRGAAIPVGPATSGGLGFHQALSEGDKRTLAFAFFLARLFADPKRAEAVVVLDDVFTSLDRHRRSKTVEVIRAISQECKQVIALGHDAYFLRDVRKRTMTRTCDVAAFELRRSADNFSVLSPFDLEEFCESPYYQRYRLVEAFVDGTTKVNNLHVAQALRPLVEGHLHRCFVGRFAEGITVGEMIQLIKDAPSENPISALKSIATDLLAFKEYAAMFHHETSEGQARTDVNDSELHQYASMALRLIRTGSLN